MKYYIIIVVVRKKTKTSILKGFVTENASIDSTKLFFSYSGWIYILQKNRVGYNIKITRVSNISRFRTAGYVFPVFALINIIYKMFKILFLAYTLVIKIILKYVRTVTTY